MISEDLKEILLKRAETSELNFNSLISFMEEADCEFILAKLINVLGVATDKLVYSDMRLFEKDDQYVFFHFLHEYAHVLSIKKIGVDGVITQFMETDPEKFANIFTREEILADRFGCYWFYRMNGKVFPRYRTQQLEREDHQQGYASAITHLMGQVTDEETYYRSLHRFIIDWKPISEWSPIWYHDVELLTKEGKIRKNFHRLQGDEDIYYGTLESNEVIYEDEVSHWREIKNEEQVTR